MRVVLIHLTLILFTIINGQQHEISIPTNNIQPSLDFPRSHHRNDNEPERNIPVPYPQCFQNELAASFFQPDVIEHIFEMKLKEEESKLKKEQQRNIALHNDDILDFDAMQLRADTFNGALLALVATQVADELIFQLSCVTNASVTQQLERFLRKIELPSKFCAFRSNPSCKGLTNYRTITGVCNNPSRPYEGSAQTAFGRLLLPVYDDGLKTPRSQSVLGGRLPSCRQISLALGSKPNSDTTINNLWVTYGQFLVHDMTFSTAVTDAGRSPITSCSCSSQDTDMCSVIEIAANDPFMATQRCIAVPTTAQAFSDQTCSLGIKEQVNGNSHYIDLSVTYGSTRQTASSIRAGESGLMKATHRSEFKFSLPPGQREGRTCVDSTTTDRCFAGGDSRLMENSVLAGVQAQWLRIHNLFAVELAKKRPDWHLDDDLLYHESKKISSALHQHYTYHMWLPILLGNTAMKQYMSDQDEFSVYDPSMPGVVLNEAATAVLRLHTFVRDLVSRCTPKGEFIDQLRFNDIASRCKFAYDGSTNGLDSFLCGALMDFGFASDTNFAHQIHHELFESKNRNGEITRSDIVALNICRGREHGLPGYNAYRKFCGLPRAQRFQDFADTMSFEAIQTMQTIYKHPDDVDLFVGVNHEQHLPDALVGPVSACIIGIQFRHLKYGDRFFYTHRGQFTLDQLHAIKKYSYQCFICHTTDIENVARNPFQPPDDRTNPLESCRHCPDFDFTPWDMPIQK